MLRTLSTHGFVRPYDGLPDSIKEEVRERVEMLRTDPHAPALRAHKLKGALAGKWSCRVNYSYRIVYCYDAKDTIALLGVGTHDVYQ